MISDRIKQAEIIDGLPFEPLALVLENKRKMGHPKDLKDIILIEEALKETPLYEVRGVVSSSEEIRTRLSNIDANFKGYYE